MLKKQQKHIKRRKRVRAKISGTNSVPRFSVFRSNKNIYAQLISDEKGKTLVAANDKELKSKVSTSASTFAKATADKKAAADKKNLQKDEKEIVRAGKVLVAYEMGKLIAEKALKKNIKKVVFDRGGYKYHGRVKAIADGAREGGLIF